MNRALRHLGIAMLELEVVERNALRDINEPGTRIHLTEFHVVSHCLIMAREAFCRLKELRDVCWDQEPAEAIIASLRPVP
jgi:hypothetical protein